jgi:hypothetical protein
MSQMLRREGEKRVKQIWGVVGFSKTETKTGMMIALDTGPETKYVAVLGNVYEEMHMIEIHGSIGACIVWIIEQRMSWRVGGRGGSQKQMGKGPLASTSLVVIRTKRTFSRRKICLQSFLILHLRWIAALPVGHCA